MGMHELFMTCSGGTYRRVMTVVTAIYLAGAGSH